MATDPTGGPRPPGELTRVHYRGDGPHAYADALLRLVRLARTGDDDFTFGPTRLAHCERDGLTLTGPDLAAPMAALTLVPGLAQTDAQTDADIDG